MSELSHIQMLVFLILMLQFTVTEQLSSSVALRAGNDVTLVCDRVKDEQDECQNIQWIYIDAAHTRTDGLVRNGQIVASRSNRLRLGEKCSLVIKNVTDQDAGRYVCRRGGESDVYLSVVTLTKYKIEHRTTFYCYTSTHKDCEPSVKWLNQDKVIIGNRDLKASQTRYYAVVSFEDSQRIHSSVMNSLTCEVTDCKSNVHQFLFRPDKHVKPATTESSTSVTTVRISPTTVTEQLSSSVAVRAGDDVTLVCERVNDEQDECQNIEWFYNGAAHMRTDALVRNGQIVASRSNRLRLGDKCSLVIKNVTDQDVGRYSCRRDGDSVVYLSVVTLTDYKLQHTINAYCFVSTHKDCEPSVKWLNQDKVFIGHRDLKASQTHYYAFMSFENLQHIHSSVMNSLTCEVTDCKSNVHQFLFRPATTESSSSVTTVRNSPTTGKDTKPATTESTTAENSVPTLITEASAEKQGWWRIIIVSVGLTTLIITVVTVDIWIRTKGNKTQKNQTTVDEDEDEDEDEGDDTVKYENAGVSSASV
ncbi:uncharacterized protein LOC114849728 [Betta splendens]|uniref:Uncharacterized protein LOC114849728 n=1 Tax=Betta splendens TaxID=158456 RepID=A0A6P7LTH7_BETSP|nr:uncharacterized protein LOC114849728 [Betta splendens]